MQEITISEIQVIPIKPQNGLVAFASAVINNQFYIGDIAIYTAPGSKLGYRLVYPDKILANGKRVNCFHPISQQAGDAVSEAIIQKYVKLMDNFNHVN
jgi:stage V sporulation protein G